MAATAVKILFLPAAVRPSPPPRRATAAGAFSAAAVGPIEASLLEGLLLLWAGRCVYYAVRPSPPPRRATAAGAFSAAAVGPIQASLLEGLLLLWAGRLCVYYALIHVGLAGSPRNPFLSHEIRGEDGAGESDGFSKWADKLRGGAPDPPSSQQYSHVAETFTFACLLLCLFTY